MLGKKKEWTNVVASTEVIITGGIAGFPEPGFAGRYNLPRARFRIADKVDRWGATCIRFGLEAPPLSP